MTSDAVSPEGPGPGHLPEYPTYLDLLGQNAAIAASSSRDLDCIVVPSGRPATAIVHAARLAEEVAAVLVVLCSKGSSARNVAELLTSQAELTWYAVDVPGGRSHPLLTLTANSVVPQQLATRSDLSRKRNLGLILGRGLGDRLLFLDDDIQLQAAGVREAAGLLADYSMVGFQPHPHGFPDNSVDVHALRALTRFSSGRMLVQESIGQHISGNSLAVNLSSVRAHFPEGVYDEDWLFMYDATARHNVTQARSTSRQSEYDPFSTPDRAAREEFGNIMSKGLYDALKSTDQIGLRDERYWQRVIEDRKKRLESLHQVAREWSDRHARRIENSLQAALAANALVSPDLCVAFYRAWYEVDRPAWSERYAALPAAEGVEHLLDLLGLLPSTIQNSSS